MLQMRLHLAGENQGPEVLSPLQGTLRSPLEHPETKENPLTPFSSSSLLIARCLRAGLEQCVIFSIPTIPGSFNILGYCVLSICIAVIIESARETRPPSLPILEAVLTTLSHIEMRPARSMTANLPISANESVRGVVVAIIAVPFLTHRGQPPAISFEQPGEASLEQTSQSESNR